MLDGFQEAIDKRLIKYKVGKYLNVKIVKAEENLQTLNIDISLTLNVLQKKYNGWYKLPWLTIGEVGFHRDGVSHFDVIKYKHPVPMSYIEDFGLSKCFDTLVIDAVAYFNGY